MTSRKLRLAQWGTKHAHARGWLEVILANRDVELVGLVEDDPERRRELEALDEAPWNEAVWVDGPEEILGDDKIDAIVVEGDNVQNLAQAEAVIRAGHHLSVSYTHLTLPTKA